AHYAAIVRGGTGDAGPHRAPESDRVAPAPSPSHQVPTAAGTPASTPDQVSQAPEPQPCESLPGTPIRTPFASQRNAANGPPPRSHASAPALQLPSRANNPQPAAEYLSRPAAAALEPCPDRRTS